MQHFPSLSNKFLRVAVIKNNSESLKQTVDKRVIEDSGMPLLSVKV